MFVNAAGVFTISNPTDAIVAIPTQAVYALPTRCIAMMSSAGVGEEVAMSSWVAQELMGAELGDIRLSRRLVRLAERLDERPEASIPQACGNVAETKAAYRFWDHEGVSPEAILQPHRQRTIQRAASTR